MDVSSNVSAWIEDLDCLDIERRSEAKGRLRELGCAVLIPLIAAAYSVTKRRCWEATSVLADVDDPMVVLVMRQLLKSSHPIVKQMAVRALARYGEENVDILIGALSWSNELTRIEIVSALEHIGARSAVLPLIALLKTANSSVLRYTVIEALGKLGDSCALEPIRAFEKDEDHHVRKRAQLALKSIEAAAEIRDVHHDA